MNSIGLIVYVGLALLIGYVGRDKKLGFVGNFLISLFLTPVVGLIVWLVQSDAAPKPVEKTVAPEKAA